MEKLILDLRGQICPSTLLLTLKNVNNNKHKLRQKKIKIVIYTDNRDALTTIPEAIEKMGFHIEIEKEKNYYIILIQKK